MPWNFGDILDAIAPVLPQDAPAFAHLDRTITWGESTRRTNNLARALIERGAKPGDKVAFYMRNRPEYMELLNACFKARLTQVNVNYRYKAEEVFYIFDNSDAQTVVYGSEFRDIIEELRPRLKKVGTFIEVSDSNDIAPFAERYETLAETGSGERLDIKRSPDDLLFIYTGGTTGMPKGVMWRHDDLREIQLAAGRKLGPVPETMDALVEAIKAMGPAGPHLPACPLMHGTGLLSSLNVVMSGGCIVTLESPSLDPEELWAAVERHKVQTIAIVGDAFAKPMLRALEEAPGKYDLSSVVTIVSSGVMWSTEVKRGLLKHIPQGIMTDSFGASEGIGFGASMMTAAGEIQTAKFQIGDRCKVFDENDQPVEPGSGKPGIIAMAAPIPVGYYKDEEKTAKTFRTINGERYSIPGDWCTVEADGTLTLLGRGSVCINTAGEKVYPEEVEEALKTHPAVDDALVIGLPDEKWGQAVTGVVKIASGQSFDEAELRAHVREQLAGYKTPKRIIIGAVPFRAPNGKADYKGVTEFAKQELGMA
ncbi:MAG TPA: acyl-CoA synthetase [Parvibaculum sp.]|uniref:acyl-CoA synthetase n=1 Tax=Parvibaculum sp. TaxID=2024848 RepID=UPI002B856E89|nr:acyl-CoA synthetase [Parvibaculum sp.]HMM14606.1 acyl-CoA synthetase [Parvibaculum sp.]